MARALARSDVAFTVINVADRAVFTLVAFFALAYSLHTCPMVEAGVDACFRLAAFSSPALGAIAGAIEADPTFGAVHGAHYVAAVWSSPPFEALYLGFIFDEAMVFHHEQLTATFAFKSPIAFAGAISFAQTVARAGLGARLNVAPVTLVAGLAVADAIEALAVCIAVWHTLVLTALDRAAIVAFVATVALADAVCARASAVAVLGAGTEFARLVTPAVAALAFPGHTAFSVTRAAPVALSPRGGLRTFQIAAVKGPVPFPTRACPIVTLATSRAIVRARLRNATIARPRVCAMALEIRTGAMAVAVVRTHHLLARVTALEIHPLFVAHTLAIVAVAVL